MLVKCEIQGSSPLLMNRFTEKDAAKVSVGTGPSHGGARGTPREQAEPKLYLSADGKPMLPGPNVFRGFVDAGQFHKIGKRQLTTGKSSLVPAGLQLVEVECPIEDPFSRKSAAAAWEVDARSVVIPATGGRVMCYRPRFDVWRISFTLDIDTRMFDEALIRTLADDLGTKIGLGDFRPARKGPFGRFLVTSWKRQAEPKQKAA